MDGITYELQPAMYVTRFEWNIDPEGGPIKLIQETNLTSNEFTLNESDMKFGLQFVYHPIDGIISLQLFLKDRGSAEVRNIQCNFWIVDVDGQRTSLLSENNEMSEDQPISEVTSSSDNNRTLYDTVFNCRASSICCEIKHTKTQALLSNFRENLWNAYKNGLRNTCVIQVEGKEFEISKTILTAQSEVFKCMFSMDNTEESQTGIVKISDINVNVVEALIQFLHLGYVENLEEIADKLFIAADKYMILDLKGQCANFIGASLGKENFFDITVFAFKQNSDELKTRILDFLSKSNDGIFMALLTSEEWHQFFSNNVQLAKEIAETIGKKLGYTH